MIIYCACYKVGYPRNSQFFWFEPKQTETQSVLVVFRFISQNQKFFFLGLFRCFGPVSKQPKKNRTFSKQTEKISKKRSLLGCPRNNYFFSVWTKTNRNSICFGCFSVCFEKPTKFFLGFYRCFGPVSKQPKQTEFMVWEIWLIF
jgi:hypothetical protein